MIILVSNAKKFKIKTKKNKKKKKIKKFVLKYKKKSVLIN